MRGDEAAKARILPVRPIFQSHMSLPNAHRVRIIGGRYRGRVIRFPRVEGVRPTPDRVRETLFNWLGQDLAELATLDLYAGSGALTLEALSRGAALAVAVDRDPVLVRAIAETARAFGADSLEAHAADAQVVAWAGVAPLRRDLSRPAVQRGPVAMAAPGLRSAPRPRRLPVRRSATRTHAAGAARDAPAREGRPRALSSAAPLTREPEKPRP